MKISPKRYIQGFLVVVISLGWAREFYPSIAYSNAERAQIAMAQNAQAAAEDSVKLERDSNESIKDNSKKYKDNVKSEVKSEAEKLSAKETAAQKQSVAKPLPSITEDIENGTFVPHRIYSVWGVKGGFKAAFPDDNDVQLAVAKKYGVDLVKSRDDAETRKDELVYVGSNPYFYIDNLNNSLPYLVPKASVLVQDIGKAFYDSLQIKGIPLHKIIVTSVLRSQEDVIRLQKRNLNATTQSCHQYGTTVDIAYNRYKTVEDPDYPGRRAVTNDTLKWVLSEVLYEMRKQNRCYVKYEVKQGCFHLTVR